MVPHAGPDTRIFRETVATGEAVAALAEVAGSTVTAEAAVLHDADAWWALDTKGLPSAELDYPGTLRRAHRALWDAGITTDFAHPEADLSRYRLVLAPSLYLVSDAGAASLRRYVEGGGTLLVQYFSGVVDERHQVRTGGYPGALREVLGIRGEEHRPLAMRRRAGAVRRFHRPGLERGPAHRGRRNHHLLRGGPAHRQTRRHPAPVRGGHRLVPLDPAGGGGVPGAGRPDPGGEWRGT